MKILPLPIILPTHMVGQFVVDQSQPAWFCWRQQARWKGALIQGNDKERRAMNAQQLLQEISDYCRQTGLAESTFGRRAVNDGKTRHARLLQRRPHYLPIRSTSASDGFMAANPAQEPRPAIIERAREPRPPVPVPPPTIAFHPGERRA